MRGESMRRERGEGREERDSRTYLKYMMVM